MPNTPKHSVSVAGVVVDDRSRVLVIQRRDNAHWEPPGGVLELLESPQQGVRREVLEETGIEVQVEGLTGVYKNLDRGVIALVFRCVPTGGLLRTSSESMRVKWVTLDEASERMARAYFIRISDAFQCKVEVREHNGVDLLPRAADQG